MKKVLSIVLAVVMVLSSLTFVMADDGIKITINGEAKKFDVMPQIIEGRTLVPMRGIFEALGAEVGWDDATKTASGKTAATTVSLTIDNKEAKVNGKAVTLDVPAMIIDSRTMVPARFVAESLGCKVDWDGTTKTVIITKEETGTVPSSQNDGWKELVKIGFEGNTVAPSTGINFWGKDASKKNTDGSFKYVTYSAAGVPKPNTADNFGDTLLKVDSSLKPSVVGISEGRINDIPADIVPYAQGGKYKMSFWICLAETTNGGNSVKLTPKVYCGKEVSGFKSAVKTFTLTKSKWTKIELNLTAEAMHVGQTTGVRFTFDAVDGAYPSVVYIDNVVFSKPSDSSDAPVVTQKPDDATQTVITPSDNNGQSSSAGAAMVSIGFEGNSVAPSTGINFWGKDASKKNTDGSFKYVTYSAAGVPKPNTADNFGDTLLKVDSSLKPSVVGISEGRINDIPADIVPYAEGGKYKMSFWICLAETTNGGNIVKLTPNVYCGKEVSGFKSAVKTFTLTKGKWTRIELNLTAEAKHVGQTTGVRFTFDAVDGANPSVVYIDNVEFFKAE